MRDPRDCTPVGPGSAKATASAWLAEPTLWRFLAARRAAPHYRLLTRLDNTAAADWMRQFDQFILATADILHMDLRSLAPLTVVMFERDKDFTRYKLQRPNGLTANVAGEFILRPTRSPRQGR